MFLCVYVGCGVVCPVSEYRFRVCLGVFVHDLAVCPLFCELVSMICVSPYQLIKCARFLAMLNMCLCVCPWSVCVRMLCSSYG